MPLRILCITDPSTHPLTDDTVHLYLHFAHDTDVELYHADPRWFVPFRAGLIPAHKVPASLTTSDFLKLSNHNAEWYPPSHFAIALDRTDKPRPEGYLSSLRNHEGRLRLYNSAQGITEVSCRSFVRTHFSDLLQAGMMTRSVSEALPFLLSHGDIVAKSDISYGGKGIFRVTRHDSLFEVSTLNEAATRFKDASTVLQHVFSKSPDLFELVRFLPRVYEGDKRVLVTNGKILGAIIRKGAPGNWINNLSAGGSAERATVEEHERTIVTSTYTAYASRGVRVLGYDFLRNDNGDWVLNEINAGNVGCFVELGEFEGFNAISTLCESIKQVARELP